MKIQFAGLVLIGCLAATASPLVFAQAPAAPMAAHSNPMVGGAAMYANKDIIDNAVSSKDHTTLVAAVKAAGLVDTLKGPGPFTVFAPTNAAFSALPKGTVEGLLKPEKKADLTRILTYHVVPGAVTSTDLMAKIKQGGGKASLTTVEGEALTARVAGKGITLTDSKGQVAQVTIADVKQSNGVIHVIDKVLMP
ncbi:fasciclin domain-containing protein [Stenotrophomonas sp. TWI377]|uniref:fasciclin domain-containing protein n=1 Tax=unclassified Stenotrophomonas TaxID=196198 RepID=UPI003207C64D